MAKGSQQTLGTMRRAQQMWNLRVRGVLTNTGHNATRAADVELANLRGATNAWETENLRFLWIPEALHGTRGSRGCACVASNASRSWMSHTLRLQTARRLIESCV